MHCPVCTASVTKVIDSRMLRNGATVKRRRKCEACDKRFTTYEKLEIHMPLIVKNDGRRENFDKDKILNGLKKACQKRPISVDEMEKVIESVKKNMLDNFYPEVSSQSIGEFVMQKLYQLDPVAYVRFASFYWDYKNIEDFVEGLQKRQMHTPNLTKDNLSDFV